MFEPPKREPDLIIDNSDEDYTNTICFWWEEMLQTNDLHGTPQWYKVKITATGEWYWELIPSLLGVEENSYDKCYFFICNKHRILNSYYNFYLEKTLK